MSVGRLPSGVERPFLSVERPSSGVERPLMSVGRLPSGVERPPPGVEDPPSGVEQPPSGVEEPLMSVDRSHKPESERGLRGGRCGRTGQAGLSPACQVPWVAIHRLSAALEDPVLKRRVGNPGLRRRTGQETGDCGAERSAAVLQGQSSGQGTCPGVSASAKRGVSRAVAVQTSYCERCQSSPLTSGTAALHCGHG